MIKIALTGKLRAGKSAVASYLSADHGFEEVAFGNAMKYYADKIFAYSDVPAYKPEVITKYGVAWSKRNPRRLYQDFGQKLRELDPNIWISHAEAVVQICEDKKSTAGIVISDLRQPNEYEWCKRNGFVIVRVSAPLEERVRRAEIAGDAFELAQLEHETESYVDSFEVDFEIENVGDIHDLWAKVDEIIEKESIN